MRKRILVAWAVATVAAAAHGHTGRSMRPQDGSPLELLDRRVAEVVFVDAPLEQVMDWLRDYTGINVTVRWSVFEDSGLERDTPISLKARNLKLSQVLWMIMNQAGGSDLKLAYRAERGLITFSLHDDFEREMIVKVYDISDLLLRVPDFRNASKLNVAVALNAAAQAGGSQSGAAGIFSGDGQGRTDLADSRSGIDSDMRQLIRLIRSTIEPDTWHGSAGGGGHGTMIPLRRQIVVRNTLYVHQLLGGYLSDELIIDAR